MQQDEVVAAAPKAGEKARRWVFTINNPVTPYPRGLARGMRYLVFQLEKGKEGTPHLQGYCEFERQQRLSGVVGCFEGDYKEPQPRGHWEVARGSVEQCKRYCTKLESRVDGPWEFGEAGKQGDRTDLRSAAAALLSSGKITDVPADIFLKYGSNCLKLSARVQGPYRPELCVVCVCGPTGIGKSYGVRNRYPNVYCPYYGNSGLWWDGYGEQEVVLFEEFAGQVQLQKLLQLLDPYPTQVECKGGSVAARYRVVFITSNRRPELWYDNPIREDGSRSRDGELAALYRRVGFKGDNEGHGFYIGAERREELHAGLEAICRKLPVAPVREGLLGNKGANSVSEGDRAPQPAPAAQVQEVAKGCEGDGGDAASVYSCGELGDGCGSSASESDAEHLCRCEGLKEVDGEYLVCHHPAHDFCFGGSV